MFNLKKSRRLLHWCVAAMVVLFTAGQLNAQDVKVSGRVTDDNGEPVVGASVVIKGTKKGVGTNVDGRYTIQCPGKATLEFQSLGYVTQNVAVNGRAVINVVLKEDSQVLKEAVITAEFGMKRVARAVGASVQNVKAKDIAESGRESFVNALQGRVAGLNVISSGGLPGSSTQVVIRSITSVSGNNQPLYVIDGVPMNNSTFDPSSGLAVADEFSSRQLDFSSRGNDLNPEDIESMTILKGAAAAALYGSDASNGAIIITTKKGSAGRGRVQYSNSFSFSSAYGYPDLQTKYANGSYGSTNWYYTKRYGAQYAAGTKLYDNIAAILQTGTGQKHSVSVEGGSDKVTFRAAASWQKSKGVVKTTASDRLNISISGKAEVTKWLKFDGSMSYTNSSTDKALRGTSGPLYNAMLWPMVDNMAEYMDADGYQMKLPSYYLDTDLTNPLFGLNKNKFQDKSDRFLIALGATVTPTKHTFVTAKFGWDLANQKYLAITSPYYYNRNSSAYLKSSGSYNLVKDNYNDPNMSILAGYNNDFGKFSVSAQFGYHQTENGVDRMAVYGSNFIDVNFASIANCDPSTIIATTRKTKRRVQALSAQVAVGYNNMAYVTLRARNDWSSTLPTNNRSYFYPAIEASLIPTEFTFLKGNQYVTYLKLRAAIAQVGKDASPLAIDPSLEQTGMYMEGYDYGFYGPNHKLKPEMTTSYEVGFEGRFLNDRINTDFTYYWTHCKDQYVTSFRLSYATGFVLNNMNVGTFNTHGWEFHIDGDVIKNASWRWNIGINASHSTSKVVDLPPSVSEYYNAYTWNSGNIRNGIMKGHPVTTLTGLAYQRNDKGQVLINPSTGAPLTESTWSVLGDREPMIKFGFSTSVSYKQFRLSALFAGRYHATVVNGTKRTMMSNGTSWESVKLREGNSVIFKGVLKDGNENSSNPTVNTISYNYATGVFSGGDEDWLEKNVNYIRLQELRFSYTVPANWLRSATHDLLSAATIWFSGNDLFVKTNYSGIDAVGNTASAALGGTGGEGYDVWSIPNPRTLSFGVSLTF